MGNVMRNYHTHTMRCKHALGTDEEFVITAIEQGFKTLGFSDHTPWPYDNGFVSNIRMDESQLGDYVSSIRSLQKKYGDRIEILIGLECEPFPQFYPWLKKIKEQYGLDYFILGNHASQADEINHFFVQSKNEDDIKRYAETTIAGLQSGMFVYLAHPEMAWGNYQILDDACLRMAETICEEAKKLNIPLEYNLLGNHYRAMNNTHGLGYPHEAFWKIAGEHGNKGIVGIDAHRPVMLTWTDQFAEAQALLRRLGVDVVEQLKI